MAIFYSDNYEDLQKLCKGNGVNPEFSLTNRLFNFGLFIEAVAIIYSVANIKISSPKSQPQFFYETTNLGQDLVFLLALMCLLIHQTYIKNNIKAVTELRISKYQLQYKSKDKSKKIHPDKVYTFDFFPANLLFSKFENCLRIFYFILLATIAGEVPYLLMIVEKILHTLNLVHTHNNDYLIYSFSTNFFIFSCGFLCVIVLAWDVLILRSFRRLIRLDGDKKVIPYSKTKIIYFIVSDSFSLGLWGCIIIFIITNQQAWVTFGLLISSLLYSGTILFRLLIKKGINVNLNSQ